MSPLVGGVVVVAAVDGAVDAVGPAAGAGPIVNRDGRNASVGSGRSPTVPVTLGGLVRSLGRLYYFPLVLGGPFSVTRGVWPKSPHMDRRSYVVGAPVFHLLAPCNDPG